MEIRTIVAGSKIMEIRTIMDIRTIIGIRTWTFLILKLSNPKGMAYFLIVFNNYTLIIENRF